METMMIISYLICKRNIKIKKIICIFYWYRNDKSMQINNSVSRYKCKYKCTLFHILSIELVHSVKCKRNYNSYL